MHAYTFQIQHGTHDLVSFQAGCCWRFQVVHNFGKQDDHCDLTEKFVFCRKRKWMAKIEKKNSTKKRIENMLKYIAVPKYKWKKLKKKKKISCIFSSALLKITYPDCSVSESVLYFLLCSFSSLLRAISSSFSIRKTSDRALISYK